MVVERRQIADGVTSANLPGGLLADRRQHGEALREPGFAAADVGKALQAAWIPIRIVLVEYPDCVNGCQAALDYGEHPGSGVTTGVIAAVADHHQGLLLASAEFKLVETFHDGIV